MKEFLLKIDVDTKIGESYFTTTFKRYIVEYFKPIKIDPIIKISEGRSILHTYVNESDYYAFDIEFKWSRNRKFFFVSLNEDSRDARRLLNGDFFIEFVSYMSKYFVIHEAYYLLDSVYSDIEEAFDTGIHEYGRKYTR